MINTNNHNPDKGEHKITKSTCCALCGRKRIIGFGWYKNGLLNFCRRCWPYIDPTIEWFETRYTLLENCIGEELGEKPSLFTLLGKEHSSVSINDGEWLTDQVIQHLSLPKGDISFEFIPLQSSIAGTVTFLEGKYQVKMSKELDDNFRCVSAILIHEMMHIYLNSHGIFYKTLEEYEEATDLACILMGFGIPMLNSKRAYEVDRSSLGIGTQQGASYNVIGYLSEQQIGYSFANFLAKRNIKINEIQDKVDPHCMDIVTFGIALEEAYRNKLTTRHKAQTIINEKLFQREVVSFSCPICFQKFSIPKETIKRIGLIKTTCPKCKSAIHYDGERVIKYTETLR
jgi:hypothetical protein